VLTSEFFEKDTDVCLALEVGLFTMIGSNLKQKIYKDI